MAELTVKFVATAPTPSTVTASALYLVKTGTGFDFYAVSEHKEIRQLNSDLSQVTAAEIAAGTGTDARAWSPQDVHDAIDAHAAGAGGGLTTADIDTLAELNAIIGDATLIDTADARLSDSRTCDNTFDNATTARQNLGLATTDSVTFSTIISSGDITCGFFVFFVDESLGRVGINNATPGQALDVTGNIAVSGTVDGRDVATDGSKLDGIEAGATADQTGAEIKSAYEAEADTNAYTDAEKTKLAGIETAADVTDATNVAAAGAHMSGGTDVPVADGGTGASTASAARTNLGAKATQHYGHIYVDAGAMVPRTTNGAEALTEEYATNDVMSDYLAFDSITEEGAQFRLAMPDDWDRSTIKVKFFWDYVSGGSNTGVTWGIAAAAKSNDDAIDAAFGASVDTDDTVIAAGDVHSVTSASVTVGGTPALGDLVWFEITRVVGDANDDYTADAKLLGVQIQYQTLTTEPAAW